MSDEKTSEETLAEILEAEAEGVEPEGEGYADPDAEIDELRTRLAETEDKLLRAYAEMENLRKRAERDRRDAETYGGTKLARELLPVHDNLKRAVDAVTDEQREAAGSLIEGVELTQRELLNAFEKHKITRVNPEMGEKFDAKLHQAMFEAPLPGTTAGTVIQVMTEGFMIGDRLLRPAQVGVSSGSPD
ncbi:nucleotide exchange factor GrpE [Pontivivens insulae]|uniref:Protein GrpE n=1 Tax=Pontivivens insulae TaxID=1639689 RepID=A0A2R8A7U9_9RHOB|nr:nucleotide exchange factor GrpE [Pontivivens insulae]RED18347.1 molecular chaperone GrpE [Pontivivens insulae]SPF28245.1 Protein GrpE [Pontivivens insulae]